MQAAEPRYADERTAQQEEYAGSRADEDSDYDYSEEEDETCTVKEGSIYTTPGVCQDTVQGVVMARGASFLASVVYGAPEA